MQWASKRARGRAGDGEFVGDGGRSPKRGTATWRRCRASGDSWSGGEEEGVEAELLSYSGERGVAGVSGYGEGVAAMASAMAGACEGEELERRGGVWGVRGREGGRFTALAGRGRRRGGEQVRGTHAVLAAEHLPACLAGKQLAGAVLGWAGRWAGCWAPGKLFPFFFLFSVF